jgi:hypothetical protein
MLPKMSNIIRGEAQGVVSLEMENGLQALPPKAYTGMPLKQPYSMNFLLTMFEIFYPALFK